MPVDQPPAIIQPDSGSSKPWSGTFSIALPKSRLYLWKPKEDISAYELAQAMPILMGASTGNPYRDYAKMIEELPAEVRRHFEPAGDSGK